MHTKLLSPIYTPAEITQPTHGTRVSFRQNLGEGFKWGQFYVSAKLGPVSTKIPVRQVLRVCVNSQYTVAFPLLFKNFLLESS